MKKNILQDISDWHESFNNLHKQLEKDILSFKNDINLRDGMISSLQKQLADLREQERYKEKFDSVSEQLGTEKDRLKKLYQQFEKKDFECKKLRKELEQWQTWLDSNKEVFNHLFSAAPINNTKELSKNPPSDNTKKKKRHFD